MPINRSDEIRRIPLKNDFQHTVLFEGQSDPNDKIIITIGSKKGVLLSPRLRVYIKERGGSYRQVGLIEILNLRASIHSILAKLTLTMPKTNMGMHAQTREWVDKNKKYLRKMGVKVVERNNIICRKLHLPK